jgi:threonine/homoserine/homoserine lactone efflux protein
MRELLPAVVLLGLAASFSPVIIATSAAQLARPGPVPAGVAFVGGVAVAAAIAELLAFALLQGHQDGVGVRVRPLISGIVSIVLGAVCLWFAYRLWWRTTEATVEEEPEGEEKTGLRTLFILGFTLMIANVRAIVTISAATNEIYAANVVARTVVIALVLLLIVVILLPAVPFVLYFVAPDTAARLPAAKERISSRAREALAPVAGRARSVWNWARPIAALVSALVGLYLVARGLDRVAMRLF